MLILSRVCADFHDAHGNIVFSVTRDTRNSFVHAPEAIQEDPLFDLLIKDGSLEAGITQARQKQMENDPNAGHDATGKLIPPKVYLNDPEDDIEPAENGTASPTPAVLTSLDDVFNRNPKAGTASAQGNNDDAAAAPKAQAASAGSGKSTRNRKADPAG